MSLTVTIVDNESGRVIVENRNAETFFGAFASPEMVSYAEISLGSRNLAVRTYNKVSEIMARTYKGLTGE